MKLTIAFLIGFTCGGLLVKGRFDKELQEAREDTRYVMRSLNDKSLCKSDGSSTVIFPNLERKLNPKHLDIPVYRPKQHICEKQEVKPDGTLVLLDCHDSTGGQEQ